MRTFFEIIFGLVKKTCKFIAFFFGGVFALAIICMLVTGFMFKIVDVFSKPPEVTYGEFPITLTYEKDGEIITQNAIYVCEYMGEDVMTGSVKWKEYIKGTGERGIIIYEENNVKIICELGSPQYYMGEREYKKEKIKPHIVKEDNSFFDTKVSVLSESQLYEQYNIKIISCDFPDPVENTFY